MKQFNRFIVAILGLVACLAAFPVLAQEQETKSQILITNVNVWDGTSETLQMGMDVLVEGSFIKQIGPGIEADAIVIDGKGGTLTPGLIDMHQHLMLDLGVKAGESDWGPYTQGIGAYIGMHELLAQGFTTVRDIAGASLGISKAVASGRFTGPRIYSSGPAISQTGGHGDWTSWNDTPGQMGFQESLQNTYVVDGVPEISQAVRANFRRGANFIKVFGGGGVASDWDPLELVGYRPEELQAIVDITNDYGGYVAVHAYTDASYNRALDAGVKSFEHGFLISEETVKRMANTEDVFWSMQGFMSIIAFSAPEEIPWFSAAQVSKGKAVNAGAINCAKMMKKHNVMTVLGSDMFAEQWPIAIENLMVPLEVGYTSFDVMKMSTSNPGKILTTMSAKNPYTEGPLGVIVEGAYADLLVVNGNPIEDVTVLRDRNNLGLIMKDGDIYKNSLVPPAHESYVPAPRTKLTKGTTMN